MTTSRLFLWSLGSKRTASQEPSLLRLHTMLTQISTTTLRSSCSPNHWQYILRLATRKTKRPSCFWRLLHSGLTRFLHCSSVQTVIGVIQRERGEHEVPSLLFSQQGLCFSTTRRATCSWPSVLNVRGDGEVKKKRRLQKKYISALSQAQTEVKCTFAVLQV